MTITAVPIAIAQSSDQAANNTISEPSYWFRILLPANLVPSQIGRASFRLGTADIIVFAADLPIEVAALQQITGIQSVTVRHSLDATILTIPLPVGQWIDAIPSSSSFHIALTKEPPEATVGPSYVDGHLIIPTTAAGRVVAVSMPDRSLPLLVGTVTKPVAMNLHLEGPGYITVPAESGVVIAAISDDLALKPGKTGFILTSTDQNSELPIGRPPVSADVTVSPQRTGGLDLPHDTSAALYHRMEIVQRDIAALAPLAQRAQSLRLARILLSLGLGPEAHGVLTDMLRDDPAVADNPQRLELLNVSNVLSHRSIPTLTVGVKPLSDRLSDDLWHGLGLAEGGDVSRASPLIAAGLIRLIAAPQLLRSQIAPLAAETLIADGNLVPAQTLLNAMARDPNVALERAELLEAEHHPHQALRAYHDLLGSDDQRTAGIAHFRWVMLRFALHEIDPSVAAQSLARHIYEWRSPRHELNVRIAIARLRAATGAWPQAFTGLIKALSLFPEKIEKIRTVRHALFEKMIASRALSRLQPLAVVSILKANADLIPTGDPGTPLLQILSAQLTALGLPDQASVALHQLIARSSDDEGKAHAGLELARLELAADQLDKAQSTLTITDAPDISTTLMTSRALIASEIAAKRGAKSDIATLSQSTDARALRVATQAAAARHNWSALEQADQKLAELTVPPTGPLDQKSTQTILQWAVAASHRQDQSTLAQLSLRYRSRLPHGRSADLFATITTPPLPVQTGLSEALAQIATIERVGGVVGTPKH